MLTKQKTFLKAGVQFGLQNISIFNRIKCYNFNSLSSSIYLKTNLNQNSEMEKPKLKIVNPILKSNKTQASIDNYLPQRDIPFFTIKKTSLKKRPPKSTPTIKTKELKYSSYKLNDACKLIRGKYIRNAIEILEASNTKGARIIREELEGYLERTEKKRVKRQTYLDNRRKLREAEDFQELEMNEDQDGKGEIKIENESEDKSVNDEDEVTEKEIVTTKKEFQDQVPYEDYRIAEAYVGRKIGQSIPSPRAKGKTDLIERSISRLFIHIEKVKAEEFYEQIAMGKADITFAFNMRRSLFTSGAPLSRLRDFSFITTSKGRHYRQQQFERLATHLRLKYYKEKGVKLSSEVVRHYLKVKLGKELAKMSPINFTNVLNISNKTDTITELNNKVAVARIRKLNVHNEDMVHDKSYKSREKQFNKNFHKLK